MEYPEPWHSRKDWDKLEAAVVRLNRMRARKGLGPRYADRRPVGAFQLKPDPET